MNRIYSVIYSEVRNGYIVVYELARRHGRHTHNHRRGVALSAAIFAALATVSWGGMPEAHAADRTTPLTVKEKDQTVIDDFDVTISAGTPFAALTIGASAADSKDSVTTVESKNITGHFTQPASVGIGEANGLWVAQDYPGIVKTSEGLTVNVDAVGTYLPGRGGHEARAGGIGGQSGISGQRQCYCHHYCTGGQ